MSALPMPEEPITRVYLHPGQMIVTTEESMVMTVLGSCVAVCLWDPRMRIAGINHYLLPQGPGSGAGDPRYGNTAMERLIDNVLTRGASPERLVAKIFGGASVIEVFSGQRRAIGEQNVQVAREALTRHGVRVHADETGGKHGRKLLFHTGNGSVFMKEI